MNDPRRYDDQEIAEILERATNERTSGPLPARGTGLTLREIEQIGEEVGIQPERIADAARALDLRSNAPAVERFLGAPRSVSRTLHIPRAPTDDEWNRVVADLRRTFDAKGKLESHGGLRSWTNSNLQVHVEPEGEGYAVRMRTRKGNATQTTIMGVVFSVIGAANGIGAIVGTGDSLLRSGLFLAFGLGMIGWVRARLPGWAATRAEQMDGLAERIQLMLRD